MPNIHWVGTDSASADACVSLSDAMATLSALNELQAELAKARLTIRRANERAR